MKSKHLLLLIIFILFGNSCLFALNTKNILILNSYHKGFQWSDDVIDGIEEVFYNKNIDTTVLYMDSKRISSTQYNNQIITFYKTQLENQKYDLILAIDKFAYQFSIKNYNKLFNNTPLLFVGLEKFDKKDPLLQGLEEKVYGILEERKVSYIIKMIDRLMPKLKTLYIINDQSASGDDTESFIYSAMKEVAGKFKINYIKKSTMKELKNKFSINRLNEAVFFIRFYNDKTGRLHKNSEIAEMINSINLPVFATDTLFIEKGIVGGKLVQIKELGINSGKMAMKILLDKKIQSNIITDNSYINMFDYEKVKQFNLNPKRLNVKYSYVNTPISLFDKYRDFMNFIIIMIPVLFLLITVLIYNLYFRVKNSKLLRNQIEFNKALLNIVENPIVWQNKDGEIIESNSKFIELMNFPSPSNHQIKLIDYIKKSDSKYLIESLSEFLTNTDVGNEIVLHDKEGLEHIYFVNYKEYDENVYNNSGVVTSFTEITKERQARLEKDKQQDFIIQQSKLAEIGEIFSSIAHQWKTPLVEISTIAQEQLYLESDNTKQDHQYVDDIMKQVSYMTETINDFQSFIMPSNRKTIFNINDAVVKMMDIISHNMKYNYIDVDINVAPDTNLMICGYRNELMQTLLNIVNNAKDKILKKQDKEKGHIQINIKNIEKFVQIEIEDNGGGIKKEYLPMIFDSYFTTKKDGHGIGLYMAKLIIEDKMNGDISVSNTINGAKFIIKLEVSNENFSS